MMDALNIKRSGVTTNAHATIKNSQITMFADFPRNEAFVLVTFMKISP